jgi:thiol-disulfide isomerase/thioredoxin
LQAVAAGFRCAVRAGALACLLAGTAHAADLKVWSGGPPPALELTALEGGAHRLADYKGKVVLVNFWATWCGPCVQEMPSIQRLKEKLAGRPFAVLAVNLDEPESRIRNFLAKVAVDFPILLDPERKTSRAWNARILPATYIVGPDGKIRYSVIGELEWDHELVAARISELLPERR